VVTLAGNRSLDAASLLPRLRLQAGAAFSPALAELDRQALLAAYNDAGFSRARVTPKIGARDGTGSYPVDYEIEEGPRSFVDDILVLGNDTTRDAVITSRIALRRGEPLSLGKMLQTQQALSDLGIFDNVEVAPQNPEADAPYQDLNVRVRESKRFTVRYGLGYETREKVRGTLELSDLNILGRAVRADMRLRASTVEQAAVLTVQRSQVQFRPVHSYFSASASSESEVSFDQVRLATSYQYSKPIGTHSWGLMRVNYRYVRVYNASEDLEPEDEPRNLTTLSAIYVNDTRDSFVDAERGFFTSTDLSVTTRWLGSNNYLSLYTQNSYYRKLPGDFVVAAALRVGLAAPYGRDTFIPISERFFAGGASSLRGFETDYAGPLDPNTGDPAGGNALVIGNFEVRLPLVKSFRLAGFYDVGNVFSYIKDIRPADFSHTIGAGLRIKTPLGPLRLDYGYNLNLTAEQKLRLYKPNQWFITIGSPF
jgi:outer membrane protein insertion porin family